MKPYAQVIVIKKNGEDGSEYPITTGRCTFGSDADCDIRMRGMEPVQCLLLVVNPDDASLVALTKEGHVELNGELLTGKATLKHGDMFVLHDRKFRFEWRYSRKSASSPAVRSESNVKQVPASSETTPKGRKRNSPILPGPSMHGSGTKATRKSLDSRNTPQTTREPCSSEEKAAVKSTPKAKSPVRSKATPMSPGTASDALQGAGTSGTRATRKSSGIKNIVSPLHNFYGKSPERKTGRRSTVVPFTPGSAIHARVATLRKEGLSPKNRKSTGAPTRRSLTKRAGLSDPNKSAALMSIHAPRRWADIVKEGISKRTPTRVQKHFAATAHRRKKMKNVVAAGLGTPGVYIASTGHANSPATIIVGRSRVRKSTPVSSPSLSQFATPSIPTDVFVSPLSTTEGNTEGLPETVAGSSCSTRKSRTPKSANKKSAKRTLVKNTPEADYTNVTGVKRVFRKGTPKADYTKVSPVARLFQTAVVNMSPVQYAAPSRAAQEGQAHISLKSPSVVQSLAKDEKQRSRLSRGSLSPVQTSRKSQASCQSLANSAQNEPATSEPSKSPSPQRSPVNEPIRSSRKSRSLGKRQSKSPQKEVTQLPLKSPTPTKSLERGNSSPKRQNQPPPLLPQKENQPTGAQLHTKTPAGSHVSHKTWSPVKSPSPARSRASSKARPPVKSPSPVRSLTSRKTRSPIKSPSPARSRASSKTRAPVKSHSPVRSLTSRKTRSPIKSPSPARSRASSKTRPPVKSPSPVRSLTSRKTRSPIKSPSPARSRASSKTCPPVKSPSPVRSPQEKPESASPAWSPQKNKPTSPEHQQRVKGQASRQSSIKTRSPSRSPQKEKGPTSTKPQSPVPAQRSRRSQATARHEAKEAEEQTPISVPAARQRRRGIRNKRGQTTPTASPATSPDASKKSTRGSQALIEKEPSPKTLKQAAASKRRAGKRVSNEVSQKKAADPVKSPTEDEVAAVTTPPAKGVKAKQAATRGKRTRAGTSTAAPPVKEAAPSTRTRRGAKFPEAVETPARKGKRRGEAGTPTGALADDPAGSPSPAKRGTHSDESADTAIKRATRGKAATPAEATLAPGKRSARGKATTPSEAQTMPAKRVARNKSATPAEALETSVKRSARGRATTPAEAAATPGTRTTRRGKAKESAEALATPVRRGARGKTSAVPAEASPGTKAVRSVGDVAPAEVVTAPTKKSTRGTRTKAPPKPSEVPTAKQEAQQEMGSAKETPVVPAKSRRRAAKETTATKPAESSPAQVTPPKKRTRGSAFKSNPASPAKPAEDKEEQPAPKRTRKTAPRSPVRDATVEPKKQMTRWGGKLAGRSGPSSPAKSDVPTEDNTTKTARVAKKGKATKAAVEEVGAQDSHAATRASTRQTAKKRSAETEETVQVRGRGRRGAIVEGLVDMEPLQGLRAKLVPIKQVSEGPSPAKTQRASAPKATLTTGATTRRATRGKK